MKRLLLALLCIMLAFTLVACDGMGTNPGTNDNQSNSDESDKDDNNDKEDEDDKDDNAHTHTVVIDKAVSPTCTESGLTEGVHCSVCKEVIVAQTIIDALGHDEVNHDAKEPTCTERGWDAYVTCKCEGCDYSTKVEKSIVGHSYVNNECIWCGEGLCSQGLEYALDYYGGSCYIVSGIGTCTDTDLVIPATYKNLPVKEIGSYAFGWCNGLTSVTMGNSVTSIGEYAFYYCDSLKTINYTGTEEQWNAIEKQYAEIHYYATIVFNYTEE